MDARTNNEKKNDCSNHFSRTDKRCCCGKLLAKQTHTGIVIRCARCKREMVIDLSQVSQEYAPV